jgi:hypothetical protein
MLDERKKEERVGELGNMARHKTRTHLLEGRKKEGLVSLETWHFINEAHSLEERKRRERVGELGNVACHK